MNELNRKILIVDDDPAMQKVLHIILEKAGFDTQIVNNGQEALEILPSGNKSTPVVPDCILLDIRMPGIPGVEVLSLIHQHYPLIPVIMLTALIELETAVDTMRRGAFDYLLKPVRKIHLVETVRKAIRFRDTMLENERLTRENREYQRSLENKVAERTKELQEAYRKLKETNLTTVQVLAETIEAKDPYTRGHCNRVRILSLELACRLGLSQQERVSLEYAALLHDIGKIGISEVLLNKEGFLTEAEKTIFNQHPLIGENIVRTVDFFNPCLATIRNHHEWYNGEGFPDGLSGQSITLPARIVSIADAFDAMTSTRPYRKAIPLGDALEEMAAGKGQQFDPDLVDIFLRERVYQKIRNFREN